MQRLGLLLAIIGAVNWGLVGLFNVDIISAIFGPSIVTRIVYVLIGIAGVLCIPNLVRTGNQAKS